MPLSRRIIAQATPVRKLGGNSARQPARREARDVTMSRFKAASWFYLHSSNR